MFDEPSAPPHATDPAAVRAALASITPELLARYDQPAPRYTSYPPVPAWNRAVGAREYRSALGAVSAEASAPLSIYVHLPFCAQRCLYCGCNVHITRRADRVDTYLDHLAREIALVRDLLGRGRPVSQLHLGGGTPNQLSDAQLERLWCLLSDAFALTTGVDASIELDPRHATTAQLATLRNLGIRRVSLGVQDLDPEVQRAIGRIQPIERVREVVDGARAVGFDGVNMDLIYGLPRQTTHGFGHTLEQVVELAPDRIACFGYAHVPAVHRHQRALEQFGLPGALERFALNCIAIEKLTGAGYTWIGLDHFARRGDHLERAARAGQLHRNFNGYTTMPAAHLLGFGMTAIGEVGGWLLQNEATLDGWERTIARGDLATVRGHRLTADDRRRSAAIMRLMCDLELPVAAAAGLEPELEQLLGYAADGLVERRGDRIAVTLRGRLFLRTLCSSFDAWLPRLADRPMVRVV